MAEGKEQADGKCRDAGVVSMITFFITASTEDRPLRAAASRGIKMQPGAHILKGPDRRLAESA
jgi:hypothetical protein